MPEGQEQQEQQGDQGQQSDAALAAAQEQARQEREERIRLEERLAAQGAAAKPQVQTYSRTELNSMVNAGSITEDQRDQILERQLREEIRQEMRGEMEQMLSAERQTMTVKQQLAAYRKSHPEAWQPGTPERQKLETAWAYLTNDLGRSSNDPALEAEALFAAFGPPVRIEEKTRQVRETHQEGSSGSDDKAEEKTSTKPKDIPKHVLDYYQKRIDQGFYKGWDDEQVKKELSHARKRARANA